ncbi:MAG: hypothetical protein ACOCQM_06640, partial [Natronomonas sp.]
PYDVTPFQFFEDYQSAEKRGVLREFIKDGGSLEAVTVEEVKDGALVDDDYDHAVLIHDYVSPTERISEGMENQKENVTGGVTDSTYTDALDDFVDAGGNLVVTDTGSYVLPELENELLDGSAIGPSDVERQTLDVARFTEKNLDHPLFDDSVREIQNQLWKVQPLGYEVSGAAPMDLIDEAAFTSAANDGVASVAGRTNGLVAAGSITEGETSGRGIHYISSLLPPATQANLHPFGLQNYTVTFLGNILFTSALGFEQVRETGSETRRYGRTRDWDVGGSVGAALTASGSRDVDSSVTPGGRANRVTVTVESVDSDAETVEIRDAFPPEWNFLGEFSDGQDVDDDVVSFGEFDVEELPSGDDEDSKTFTYFIESPDDPEDTNAYEVGPAEAVATVDDEDVSDTFAPAENVVAVGVSP